MPPRAPARPRRSPTPPPVRSSCAGPGVASVLLVVGWRRGGCPGRERRNRCAASWREALRSRHGPARLPHRPRPSRASSSAALARLALPGPDPMSIGMTILIGIAGSFIGGLVMLAITGGRNAGGIVVSVAGGDADRLPHAPPARRQPHRPGPGAAGALAARSRGVGAGAQTASSRGGSWGVGARVVVLRRVRASRCNRACFATASGAPGVERRSYPSRDGKTDVRPPAGRCCGARANRAGSGPRRQPATPTELRAPRPPPPSFPRCMPLSAAQHPRRRAETTLTPASSTPANSATAAAAGSARRAARCGPAGGSR